MNDNKKTSDDKFKKYMFADFIIIISIKRMNKIKDLYEKS